MMTREFSLSPVRPSKAITDANAEGGTARRNSRLGLPPIARSASSTASTRGLGLSGSAAPKLSLLSNACQAAPLGLARPYWATAALACARNCSSVIVNCAGAEPTIRYSLGSRLDLARWNSPGRSLRLARSPVAPNRTMTWSSGSRPDRWLLGCMPLIVSWIPDQEDWCVVSIEQEKRVAAEAAALLVEDGMTVGLGTGTTVSYLLPALARRGLSVRCVATSDRTASAAAELGLAVESFDALDALDALD